MFWNLRLPFLPVTLLTCAKQDVGPRTKNLQTKCVNGFIVNAGAGSSEANRFWREGSHIWTALTQSNQPDDFPDPEPLPGEPGHHWGGGKNLRLLFSHDISWRKIIIMLPAPMSDRRKGVALEARPLWQDSWHYLIFNQLGGSGVDSASLLRRT